jgi:hypothetical protein
MADLSVTAASVAQVSGGKGALEYGVAGGTITQGMPIALGSNGRLVAAANTSASAAAVVGISLVGASSGQPVTYQTHGQINPGATVAVGMPYVLSAAGLMAPVTDATTTDYMTYLGVGVSTSAIDLSIHASGVLLSVDIT